MKIRSFTRGCAVVLLVSLVGCSEGSRRYTLSGRVTHAGKPVAAGSIVFQPDPAKGNDGPGGVGVIKNGRFETKPGMGAVGGPHLARVTIGDGIDLDPVMRPYGNVLGDFVIPLDLPRQSGEVDLDIPAKK